MPARPLLSRAARPATYTVDAHDETGERKPTPIAGEHPLTLYVDKREILTLMTLGAAPEALAIGFLRNQRLVTSLDEIVSVQVDWDVGAVAVKTRHGLADLDARTEKRTATTGCGQGTVFGDLMEDIESIRLPADARLDEDDLFGLLNNVRIHESIYKEAGAVHGCALAKGAEILTFVEDVGRHNAVDAIAGWMLARGRGRRRQGVLHDGPAHLGDGDQGGADGHPVPRVALRAHQDGPRDRRQGRHHDDRARGESPLSSLHGRGTARPARP